MILQALYDLAQKEGLMEDPNFELKPVAWLVRLSDKGELLGIVGTHVTEPGKGNKPAKETAKVFPIPRQPTGRAGTKAPASFFGAPGRAHSLGGESPLHTRQGEVLAEQQGCPPRGGIWRKL